MANIFDLNTPPTSGESLDGGRSVRTNKRLDKLTSLDVVSRKTKLVDLTDTALAALEDAMKNADHGNSVKAAQIVLDRTGFGPKSTVEVSSVHMDLSKMTTDDLMMRLEGIRKMLSDHAPESKIPIPTNVLDVTPIEKPTAAIIPFNDQSRNQ